MKACFFILLSIILLTAMSSQAQTINIYGQTRVHITYKPIPYVYVYVMDKDSTILASGISNEDTGLNPGGFRIDNVPLQEFYIIKLSCLGYETTCMPLIIKKKPKYIDMGNVTMKRVTKFLDEVVVKATKIKMVVKNDTIVYNADAFQLSEGSMLDNLVKQLPGVELNDAGQITVNGRFVSSLLVNGKDFFKGNPNVALENLPAYMVNKVKVYEKEQGDAYLMKNKDNLDKDLVMDVNLKKQYSIGFIANAEGGYGSNDRYFGKLFGLRFTDHSRLSFFANFNNLNQNQKPGSSGNWNREWTPTGLTNLKMGGLDLAIDEKTGKYQLNSNLYIQSEDIDNQTISSGVTFLPDNDSYTFGRNNSRNKKFSLTSNHELIVTKPGLWSKYTASVGYYHWNDNYLNQGAEFDKKPTEAYRGQTLDSLFSPGQYMSLASALINSHQEKGLSKGDQFNATFYGYVSLGHLRFVVNGLYDKNATKQYSQYGLNTEQDEPDFRNRYSKIPSERYNYDILARYLFNELLGMKPLSMALSYTFANKNTSGDKTLYRLDRYKGWDSFDGHPLGYLPSGNDSLQQVMDLQNSYFSKERNLVHTPKIEFWYRLPVDDYATIALNLPLNIGQDKLSYQRAELDTIVRRNKTLFTPELRYSRNSNGEKSNKNTNFAYTFIPSPPRLISMLDTRDDSDPLSIQLGNPKLRDEKIHRITFKHTYSSQRKQRNLGLNMDWEVRLDAIGQSMIYNEESGVRTYIPQNINGNWKAGVNFNYSQAVDKKQHWQLSTATDARYINSVDWISTTGIDNTIRSLVKNFNLTETLKADYRAGELHIGTKVGAKWIYATSERENFTTINSVDINYGVSALVPLLWKFKLSTDLTLYSRRGYSNSSMNTDDVVWNATISRSFMHGNLTCSIDGFDILKQLSNIYQTVNVQGRTETWYNSVPRYYMFRVIYRLNREPKKRH